MHPSLFALFARSKFYHRLPPSEAGETAAAPAMQERERFATAAVAFVWKHSESFRTAFFRSIRADQSDPAPPPDARLTVEEDAYSDLRLTYSVAGQDYVYVVELKIDASVADHQDFEKRQFLEAGGYGRVILAGGGDALLRYVILAEHHQSTTGRNVPEGKGRAILCSRRTWGDIAREAPLDELTRDLYTTLGRLGLSAFFAANLTHMKVPAHSADLRDIVMTIEGVTRDLGITKRGNFRTEPGNDCVSLGVGIPSSGDGKCAALQAICKSENPEAGWFGYIAGPLSGDATTKAAIWFYCGDAESQQAVLRSLEAALPAAKVSREAPVKSYFNVIVERTDAADLGDADWFKTVFGAVLALKG